MTTYDVTLAEIAALADLGEPAAMNRAGQLAEDVALVETAFPTALNRILESAAFGEAVTAVAINVLLERVATSGTATPSRTRFVHSDDGVSFEDALAAAWGVLAEEGVDLLGSASATPTRIAVIVDSLHAMGVVSNRVDALAAVAAALAINTMAATGWKVEAVDSVGFQEAFQAALRVAAQLLDGAGFADSVSPSLRMVALVDEAVELDDSMVVSREVFETLTEEVLFYTTIRLGAAEYAGWVLNEGAASEYRNYPFNGFVEIDGRYYGTSDNGLYELVGDTDAGEDIDASIKTALMDFGVGVLKRIPDVYIGYAGGGTLVLKVITTGQRGEQVESVYTATYPDGAAMHNRPIKIGQGLKSRYWQFELANTNGADFDLDEITFRPLLLDRRV